MRPRIKVDSMIETAPFGSTGHLSSRVIFGGAALGAMSQERAAATLDLAVAAGVNHLDTAHSYGHAEVVMNPWLAEHRSEVFLATKTRERSGEAARAGLEDSLRRLGVEQVDLIQLHNLVEEDEWREAFAPGGAVEALATARDEGLVRFIGVTGHGLRIPAMHMRSLDEFAFDSVLFPLNYSLLKSDAFAADVDELIARCVENGIAIQTIKSVAKSRWESGYDGPRFSWYEPLRDEGAVERAVRFVLGREHLFLNSTSDGGVLPMVLDAAKRAAVGDVPTDDEMEHDLQRFEIAPLFDGADLERI